MRLTLIALLLAGVVGCDSMPQGLSASAQAVFRRAQQGEAAAQYNLGVMYYYGKGVPEDYTEAAKWYRKAAEQGHVTAQWMLGGIYYQGEDEGVPDNDVEAYAWFSVAATNGQEDLLGWLPKVKAKLTPEQLTEGQKRVEELLEKLNAKKAK